MLCITQAAMKQARAWTCVQPDKCIIRYVAFGRRHLCAVLTAEESWGAATAAMKQARDWTTV